MNISKFHTSELSATCHSRKCPHIFNTMAHMWEKTLQLRSLAASLTKWIVRSAHASFSGKASLNEISWRTEYMLFQRIALISGVCCNNGRDFPLTIGRLEYAGHTSRTQNTTWSALKVSMGTCENFGTYKVHQICGMYYRSYKDIPQLLAEAFFMIWREECSCCVLTCCLKGRPWVTLGCHFCAHLPM